jgi:hypothetical protein
MIPDPEAWQPYTPRELADRLSGLRAPWYVAGGWALDLFLGRVTRPHHDLEIALPAAAFPQVKALFPGWEFFVPEAGTLRPADATALADEFQTWALDPEARVWRFDVFREPHDGDTWICRRDATLRRPYAELIRHTPDGIPYPAPEVVLLFKAKAVREKDAADFALVLPELDAAQQAWLGAALDRVHPCHEWRRALPLIPPSTGTRPRDPAAPPSPDATAARGRPSRS